MLQCKQCSDSRRGPSAGMLNELTCAHACWWFLVFVVKARWAIFLLGKVKELPFCIASQPEL